MSQQTQEVHTSSAYPELSARIGSTWSDHRLQVEQLHVDAVLAMSLDVDLTSGT